MSSDKCSSLLVERQSGDASEVVLEVPAVGIRNTRSLDAAGTDGFEDGELSVIRGAPEGCRTIPSIQPNTVVVAAMPSAKVSTATAVRDGVRRRTAAAYRRSSRTLRMGFLSLSAIWLPTVA